MIHWGIIGCGNIAHTFAQSMTHTKQGIIRGCAARQLSRAIDFSNQYRIEKVYDDYLALINDPLIDAIYIATPHNFHAEHIALALSHQKHVLCEKPLALNQHQAQHCYALSHQHKCLLVEGTWTRFLPAIQDLQLQLAKNVIGRIKHVSANFSITGNFMPEHRLLNPDLGGGALLDLGIYPITLADIVFAKPPSMIQSSYQKALTGVDENSFYQLQYDCGAVAQLSAGYAMHAPTHAIISGDTGYITIPDFLGAQEYTIHRYKNNIKQEPTIHSFPFTSEQHFKFEIEHCHDMIMKQKTQSTIIDEATNIRMMTIMDIIRHQWGLLYPQEEKVNND